jgi:hypothetical protein
VVEGTRLLIWRTGNGTEGSNPSLSAKSSIRSSTFPQALTEHIPATLSLASK